MIFWQHKRFCLYWNDYEFSVGVVKPTKTFINEDRGADKFNYYKRNDFFQFDGQDGEGRLFC